MAPRTSALCHPKDILWLLGFAAIQMANKEIMKEAKSADKIFSKMILKYFSDLLTDEQHQLLWPESWTRLLQQLHQP